jgi:putative ABC transport system permease protein
MSELRERFLFARSTSGVAAEASQRRSWIACFLETRDARFYQEAVFDQGAVMDTLWQDVRYGARMLLKKPSFAVPAILALALGIGANSAIFSVVNGVLLRPLPYEEPERLVLIQANNPQQKIKQAPTSLPDFLDWREQASVFEQIAVFSRWNTVLTGGDEPERLSTGFVSSNFFSTAGVKPIIGRAFSDEENRTEAEPVVVVSSGLWKRRFGADANLIGQSITLSGKSGTVIGIMPDLFNDLVGSVDVWLPIALNTNDWVRDSRELQVLGRLKQGVTLKQADAEMSTIAARLEEAYPKSNAGWGANVISLHSSIVGDVRAPLWIMLGAVFFVLLIACANVANLLLARAVTRHKEVAIRTALGASRPRIIRQLLTESLLLSAIGGALGLLLAVWGIKLLVAISPDEIPRMSEINLDGRVLTFAVVVSLVTGLIFGLVPALQASKLNLNESLKEGGRGSTEGLHHNRIRSLLIVSELALALVLLVGAGLLIKSFIRLQSVYPGFNAENVLTVQLALPQSRYRSPQSRVAFFDQLMSRLESVPGAQSAGLTLNLPLNGGGISAWHGVIHAGRPITPEETIQTENRIISPGYFRTMNIPLLKGRELTAQDNRQDASPVVIVSDTLARQLWPDEDPIGKRIQFGHDEPFAREVVGVVGDIKRNGFESTDDMATYITYAQQPWTNMVIVARAASDPMSLAGSIKSAVQAVDKDQPIHNIKTLDTISANSTSQRRFNLLLIGVFASVALALAAVGIYGVMSYSVTQRTHEIGIRMALGATSTDVLRLVVGQGLILAFIGIGIGIGAALAVTQIMDSLLYGVSATDPITFVITAALLTGIALAASFIPARRAARVDPMIALRYE